jgi:hypothetical protein
MSELDGVVSAGPQEAITTELIARSTRFFD